MDATTEIDCIVTARKCLEILGVEHLPLPQFSVISRTGARWVGRCKFHALWRTSKVILQRRIVRDEQLLASVVAHEMIHHVLFLTLGTRGPHMARGGHGRHFQDMMAKLNAVLGADFVRLSCDDQTELARPITLVMYRKAVDGRLRASWFSRATPRVDRYVAALAAVPGAEVRLATTRGSCWALFPKAGSRRFAFAEGEWAEEGQQLWDGASVLQSTQAA